MGQHHDQFNFTSESQLSELHVQSAISDFYDSGMEGSFTGRDSIQIFYKFFENKSSDKAIMISAGRTEAAIKYKELLYDLYRNGYSVFIHDHRGQGQSGRMLPDTEMGYVDSFQYYIDDMKFYHDRIVAKFGFEKLYLIGHSMGGAIGMTYIQQYPNDFDAACFSSPMLGLPKVYCTAGHLFEKGKPKYAIGQHAYDDQPENYKNNDLTTCQIRYDRMVEVFHSVPEAKLGGVTYKWLAESCHQFDYMMAHISDITIPIVIFSASDERIVDPKSHIQFAMKCNDLNIPCELQLIAGARHELLIESDRYRTNVLKRTLSFFIENE